MTCALGYESVYPIGCNISQWGEGCEQCIPIFQGSWMPIIYLTGTICLFFLLLYIIFRIRCGNSTPSDDSQLWSR